VFMGDDNDDDDGDGRSSPAGAETYTPMSPSEDDDDVGKNIADCLLQMLVIIAILKCINRKMCLYMQYCL